MFFIGILLDIIAINGFEPNKYRNLNLQYVQISLKSDAQSL